MAQRRARGSGGDRPPSAPRPGRLQRTPAPKPNRPRDPDAPPKPKRPRDPLGRPLSWDASNELTLEDYDRLPLARNHELGMEHFNAQRFFPAHEAWETAWKQTKGTGEAEFFKGLSQLGAGYTHLLRGNPHGASTLLRRGAGRIERFGPNHRGVDAVTLARTALDQAGLIEEAETAGNPVQPMAFPTV